MELHAFLFFVRVQSLNHLPIELFVLISVVASDSVSGTRGWVIVFGTHHLVVEPFYYNHYRLWSEVVNLAADFPRLYVRGSQQFTRFYYGTN